MAELFRELKESNWVKKKMTSRFLTCVTDRESPRRGKRKERRGKRFRFGQVGSEVLLDE